VTNASDRDTPDDPRVNEAPAQDDTEEVDPKPALEDEVDEASDESFPASDPPSY
jgi:hypothetical protein